MAIQRIDVNITNFTMSHVLEKGYLTFFSGTEAKKLFDEAQLLLKEIIRDGSLEARGIVAFYPANSVGDDIIVYDPVKIRYISIQDRSKFSKDSENEH